MEYITQSPMDELHELIEEDINSKIQELANEYRANPGIILTETDMQCLLYKKFLEISILNTLDDSKDGYKTYAVHTELSWFDISGKLTLKPDITILIPDYLTVTKHKNINFPTKGYVFEGGGIIFELKFNRYKSMKSFIKYIKQDLEKIDRLLEIHPSTTCYFVWMNKYNVDDTIIDMLLREHRGYRKKLIYLKGSIDKSIK